MTVVPPTFIGAAATGLHRAGVLNTVSRVVSRMGRAPAFQILTYHRVNDDGDPFFPALPSPVFEAQMRHVAETYTVLDLEELVARMADDRVPRGALAITFDDGYRDNLTHAAPILARYGLRATIFLATAYIGGSRRPWFDEVAMAFKTTRAESVVLPSGVRVDLALEGRRLAALDEAWTCLKRLPETEFDETLHRLIEDLAPFDGHRATTTENGMLAWREVQTLSRRGFTVGAHTVTHPILANVSPARALREIEGSRDAIRAATGQTPGAFAYPNGMASDYNASTVDLVRRAGFTCAVTCCFGINTRDTSPWELRRGGPWEHHLPTFALKLAGYRLLGA